MLDSLLLDLVQENSYKELLNKLSNKDKLKKINYQNYKIR